MGQRERAAWGAGGSLDTRAAASCSFCGPGQLEKEHLPPATVVSLCPSPWHRGPALVLCDPAGQQPQLRPLRVRFFTLLTLKISNNSGFRSSRCIWNFSDSLVALVSRHQPKNSSVLWLSSAVDGAKPHQTRGAATSGVGTAPFSALPCSGGHCWAVTAARGHWGGPGAEPPLPPGSLPRPEAPPSSSSALGPSGQGSRARGSWWWL